ncbi:GATOR complex protein WDR59 isoform X1 [Diorhabda sublineata]|uniref:GATOR complex protein WDR59 isoform X1 n=1 Tax=Diorhabda sublineata TaxID=1163346 RepID=UPI0024E18186|nr:GATOR complex protein WDR59 isoform X1 [Diorhabda sublineata]
MSSTWNGEYYIALECKDLQANAMAIDSTGNIVLLAGRRYLAIRNLEDCGSPEFQKFPRQSKYDVGAAEWNPTHYHKELCVISSNQRLDVLTWRLDELIATFSVRAHTRVITDLNWHKFDPNLLASCSVDTFIHLWDLRDSRRPTLSLSAIAEASQVKWNKVSTHLLATAHEGDIKIWDQRKGTAPVQYIAAHLSKIHGLDWSPTSENHICSSSQDNTVKFFDTTNPRRAECVLTTNAPVWRARYTPFGTGLVTAVVPQLRRGENSLLLWNTANRATPMHTFVGHRDVVLEFEWKKQTPGDSNFQLVTWSKDQTLLVWKIEPFIQKLCGYEPVDPRERNDLGRDTVDSFKLFKKASPKIQPLQQEFSLLNVHIPNLVIKRMDSIARYVLVSAAVNNFNVHLKVSFPSAYPHGVPPGFEVIKEGSNINESIIIQLLQMLKHLAQQRVSKNRTCLEPCLRQMVTTLEQLSTDNENNRLYNRPYLEPSSLFSGYNDAYIPFPRTSGAKFCSVGTLVCFNRPMFSRRLSTKMDATPRIVPTTPRALSALENIYSKRNDDMTVSAFYYQRQRSRVKQNYSKITKAVVHIYDTMGLSFVNRQLAEEYILDGDVGTICKHNAAAAAVVGRWDLVQAWTLAELVAGPQQADEENLWNNHPFGNKLMQSLISHYASQHDVQMAAMLCCIFGKEHDVSSRKSSLKSLLPQSQLVPGKKWLKSEGSPYHTIPSADVVADGWVLPMMRTTRSSSLDNLTIEGPIRIPPPKTIPNSMYEYYKLAYAETLHRWQLIYNRIEVLKYMSVVPEPHKGVEFVSECKDCLKPTRFGNCKTCRKLTMKCIVCDISVRGSANTCAYCGHGGHTKCLKWWFSFKDICLTGCGCKCLIEAAEIFTA